LNTARYRKLMVDWQTFLQADHQASAEDTPNAMRPAYQVASERIYRMFRRVIREGNGIDAESPAEDLHELRKSCKKLRYLMEFFQSLYPDEIRDLIKAIKVLLDNLGDFQDLEVQANKLELMAVDMRKSRVATDTLLAIGMLIEGLLQRQEQERERFYACFKTFATLEKQAQFKALFKENPANNRTAPVI
jgi:CHAD domain-containing protein